VIPLCLQVLGNTDHPLSSLPRTVLPPGRTVVTLRPHVPRGHTFYREAHPFPEPRPKVPAQTRPQTLTGRQPQRRLVGTAPQEQTAPTPPPAGQNIAPPEKKETFRPSSEERERYPPTQTRHARSLLERACSIWSKCVLVSQRRRRWVWSAWILFVQNRQQTRRAEELRAAHHQALRHAVRDHRELVEHRCRRWRHLLCRWACVAQRRRRLGQWAWYRWRRRVDARRELQAARALRRSQLVVARSCRRWVVGWRRRRDRRLAGVRKVADTWLAVTCAARRWLRAGALLRRAWRWSPPRGRPPGRRHQARGKDRTASRWRKKRKKRLRQVFLAWKTVLRSERPAPGGCDRPRKPGETTQLPTAPVADVVRAQLGRLYQRHSETLKNLCLTFHTLRACVLHTVQMMDPLRAVTAEHVWGLMKDVFSNFLGFPPFPEDSAGVVLQRWVADRQDTVRLMAVGRGIDVFRDYPLRRGQFESPHYRSWVPLWGVLGDAMGSYISVWDQLTRMTVSMFPDTTQQHQRLMVSVKTTILTVQHWTATHATQRLALHQWLDHQVDPHQQEHHCEFVACTDHRPWTAVEQVVGPNVLIGRPQCSHLNPVDK
jgi:hypothetical protein